MRYKFFSLAVVAALGSFATADVVFDQMSLVEGDNGPPVASQDFEVANNANDVIFADNFTVDAAHLTIDRVEAVMGLFTGGGPLADGVWSTVTDLRVEFHTSIAAALAGLTGDAGSQTVSMGSVTRTNLAFASNGSVSHVDMAVNVALPAAGQYWVSVMGVMPAGTNQNQIGVTSNTTNPGDQNGTLVNPAGGFGLPGNNFDIGQDASYRLHSTPVPEPASMIALGLGAAALVARHRRKA